MMTPGMNINNFNAGTSMPTYSGRGRPPLNPQPVSSLVNHYIHRYNWK